MQARSASNNTEKWRDLFARHLNVSTSLMSQWEPGEKRPRGASLKLLMPVAKNGLGTVA